MVAKLVVLYGHPEDPAAFDAYYEATHIPIAKAVPGLRSYSISTGPVMTPAGPSEEYHLVATLVWDSIEELQAGLGSPKGAAASADMANFATGGATALVLDEREV